MSTPSRSVWSGQSSNLRPKPGIQPTASTSAMPNMPTNTPTGTPAQPITSNTPAMPSIPLAPAQPVTPTPSPAPVQPISSTTPPPVTSTPPPTSRPSPRPASDDIIIPPSEPAQPKNKKPLIIGAIIVAGVAVIAGLIFLLTGSLRGSAPVEATDAKGKFNIYANYLLFGTDSKDPIPDYNPEELYTFESVFNQIEKFHNGTDETITIETNETNSQYINKLKNVFDDFYNTYSTETSEIAGDISEYKESIDFIHAYVNFIPPSDEDILATTDSDFKELYQVFYDLGSDIGEDYGDYNVKNAEAIVELAKIYEEAGCDFNQDVETAITCLENANISEESITKLDEIDTILLDNESKMATIVSDSADDFIDQCWSVKNEIR